MIRLEGSLEPYLAYHDLRLDFRMNLVPRGD